MTKQLQKKGRPTVMKADVVRKLQAALAHGFSVTTACQLSGISRATYYEFINCDNDFSDKMKFAEEWSTYRARQVVLEAINKGDVQTAKWYLERKERLEFAPYKPL